MTDNQKIYLDRMRASMKEKLFWLEKIPDLSFWFSTVIDFGCADGELLAQLQEYDLKTVGIDHNETFLQLAKSKLSNEARFYASAEEYLKDFRKSAYTTIFNLSSVLHEVYSFCSKTEIDNILKAAITCDYITIRDMLRPSMYLDNESILSSKPESYDKYAKEYFATRNHSRDNDIQYMMKTMYLNNWESEIKEDYFSVDWEYIDKFFKKHGFELMYKNDYSNEYVAKKLSEPNLITHRQLIYKKRNSYGK